MNGPDPELEPHSAQIAVMARLMADLRSGHLRTLDQYKAQFPGQGETVEGQYRLVAETPAVEGPGNEPLQGEDTVGPYQLERELGRGAQGTVWLARDPRLERSVALKVVTRSSLVGDVPPRFRREARAASRLEHPGICPVYEFGAAGALAWIAMRYVPGETLEQVLRERRLPPTDINAAVALIEQIARALHAAHSAGIVHRDVKPANVIVTPEGQPILLDFGVAQESEGGPPLTLTGDALGTPAYMSPEQLAGERTDPRTDVWSLGATAYEFLCGVRPFDAPTLEGIVRRIARREPEPASSHNPAISSDLKVVLATALSKEKDRRYESALAFAEDLRRVREHRPVLARPAGVSTRVGRWGRRNPVVATSLATVLMILLSALLVSTNLLSRTRVALAANTALLGEVIQLSDAKVARDLISQEQTLWPASPERADDMQRWLLRARSLEARVGDHRRALASVDERLSSKVTRQIATAAAIDTKAWMVEQLTEIITSIEELLSLVPRMEARHALASSLRRVTIDQARDAWNAAAERVLADARFDGFELAPQLGLLPLGPDPGSGLEEFSHLASGEAPGRNQDRQLEMLEASSIVLILIPGGEVTMGCVPPGPERREGTPYVDPAAHEDDGPLQHLRLDPFFVSKFEMTSGQWERHTRQRPALYAERSSQQSAPTLGLLPVERVSWDLCEQVLGELELTLPTEAQWEHAARGGTTSVWFTGNEPKSLIGYVNLADDASRRDGGAAQWEYEPGFEDPFVVSSPVGSFAPNAFGLHDTAGNVCEWLRNPLSVLDEYPPRDGDGMSQSGSFARVIRGGSFAKPADHARVARRDFLPASLAFADIGLRPARALD